MVRYPYEIHDLVNGTFRLRFDDFPVLQLFGKSHFLLRMEAALALDSYVSLRMKKKLQIPEPRAAMNGIPIQEQTAGRLRLYWTFFESGLALEEFANKQGISTQSLSRHFDMSDECKYIPQLEAVLSYENDIAADERSRQSSEVTGENLRSKLAVLAC